MSPNYFEVFKKEPWANYQSNPRKKDKERSCRFFRYIFIVVWFPVSPNPLCLLRADSPLDSELHEGRDHGRFTNSLQSQAERRAHGQVSVRTCWLIKWMRLERLNFHLGKYIQSMFQNQEELLNWEKWVQVINWIDIMNSSNKLEKWFNQA